MTIRIKLLITLFFISAMTISLLAYISTESAKNSILTELEESINGIVDVTSERIYDFIREKELIAASFADNDRTGEALVAINGVFNQGVDSKTYKVVEKEYRESFNKLLHRYSLYDILLINLNGDVIFTIEHELDFSSNLFDGPYKDTSLAYSFKDAVNLLETKITPFAAYSPSLVANNQRNNDNDNDVSLFFSSFISTPVFYKNKLVGVFAIQINSHSYYHLSQDYSGLKQTGQILIGHLVNEKALIISPVRHSQNASFNLSFNIGSDSALALQQAVLGNRGSGQSISFDDSPIIAAWRHIPELNWGVVAHMKTTEALKPVNKLRLSFAFSGLLILLFTSIIALYFSKIITVPITRLLKAVRLLSDGQYDQTVLVTGKDEVAQLAQSFNDMLQMRKMHEQAIALAALEGKQLVLELNEQKDAIDHHSIVATTNVKGDITFCNKKFSEISGYSEDELIGKNHRILNSGYHSTDFFKEMYRTIASGKVWHNEVCNKAKSGKLYWVDTTIVPFMNSDGKPESYVAIRTDITHAKEQELSLIEAKEEAEQAVISKGEFLASMSHEIRTPMNGVLGMLGLLLNTKLTADQVHKARIAQSSAKSLLTLINDILDFSKVEAGKLELENLDFNLRKVLGDFADSIAHQAQGKGLELILDITHIHESNVIGDSSRLRQILFNIVGNAIKFTSSGEIVIEANIQSLNEQYWQLNCNISDTGIGIPQDKLDSLFESFSQVDASTTRKYGGTGLGLAIVKKLCELMDGQVKVTSEIGKGTCFSFNIKLQKSNHSKIVVPEVEIDKLNLLIVDDNKTNREVLRGQLEHWGASVWEASSGKQALELCAKRLLNKNESFFDIALLDMQMPDMDGAELGQRFKTYKEMKLVMMTSVGHKGDAQYFADLGFSAYFPKPATTSDIFDALSIVVDGGESLQNAKPLVTSRYLQTLEHSANKKTVTLWPEKTRILLVEDNQINQMVASGILSEMGLHVDVAGNGVEALDCLRQSPSRDPFTLILMDCQMPEMDGYEATREIRKEIAGKRFVDIPIVAMTANAMEGDREICIAAGMDDYVSKPIEPEILKNILVKWLIDTDNNKHQFIPKISETATNEKKSRPLDKINDYEKNNVDLVWDKESALSRLMNDEPLLNKLISIFIDENNLNFQAIVDAVKSKNSNQLREAAHSLKGVVANLGGIDLQNQLSTLESVAKENNIDQAIALLPIVQKSNSKLLEAFINHKAKNQSTENIVLEVELDPHQMNIILQTLNQQIKQNDFIDSEVLEPLKNSTKNQKLQKQLDQLIHHISQFDNDSAFDVLKSIANLIHLNLEPS